MATSNKSIPEYLDLWAKIKGIKVLGTGDFTHPVWINELQEKLEPAYPGLYRLKKEYIISPEYDIKSSDETLFLLTSEISCIYKKNGKVRKVHNLLFAPDFETVKKIQMKLSDIGNIRSDGRPILGLDAKDLFDLVLNINKDCFLVPAHIWTPWFSVLGSKSGFNDIKECFEDLTEHIFAIETGLSSDPPMNWMCSFLDKFSLMSNSDAHSPEKIGREANIFNTDLSYFSIRNALKENNKNQFLGTIEFFPQEGKYHHDGHRKCGINFNPFESVKNNNICPVCGKPLTLGVMFRVAELSDRINTDEAKNKNNFYSMIPLTEILSEITGLTVNSVKLKNIYFNLIKKFGSEFNVLLNNDFDDLTKSDIPLLSEAIKRMRLGKVIVNEGYDGEYGIIKVFDENELNQLKSKNLFFVDEIKENVTKNKNIIFNDLNELKLFKEKVKILHDSSIAVPDVSNSSSNELNQSQTEAVNYLIGQSIIIAGPGTGKTKTLTYKIANIIKAGYPIKKILNLTFSNQAAKEIKERIIFLLPEHNKNINVFTFHSFGLSIIKDNLSLTARNQDFSIIDNRYKELLLKNFFGIKNASDIIQEISNIKQNLISIKDIGDMELKEIFINYTEQMIKNNFFDFDDLLYIPVYIFTQYPDILKKYRELYQFINIDEYQDINSIQYKLIKMTANENINLTVIGDPNQAIYGFRGASSIFFNNFINDFPLAKIFNLSTSYRCPDNILDASSQVINGKNKMILTGIKKGFKINIKEYETDKAEAEFTAREIEKLSGGLGFFSFDSNIAEGNENESSLKDIAVLCRTGKQMDALIKAFNDHNVPYEKIGEIPFYFEMPFIEIIDIIKLVLNKNNNFLFYLIEKHKIDIEELNKINNEQTFKNFIKFIIEKYFRNYVESNKNEIEKFYELTDKFNDLTELIKFIEVSDNSDAINLNSDRVKIMTMHASKGLEFDNVFIIGASDKIIPFTLYESYKTNIEEEERLLYVAMTRSKKNLFISYSKKINFSGFIVNTEISPFVKRIKKQLIDFEKKEQKFKDKNDDGQLELF